MRDKAIIDRDVSPSVPMVKIAERRATLLGLNAPIGLAVSLATTGEPADIYRPR